MRDTRMTPCIKMDSDASHQNDSCIKMDINESYQNDCITMGSDAENVL